MKDKKTIITAVATLVIGLIIGYFVFGGNGASENVEEDHVHTKSTNEEGKEVWTCSMHPQIRQPEAGKCPICGMDLILADANGNSNPLVFEMTEDAIKIANIQTTKIGAAGTSSVSENEGLKLSGKIQANETTTASIVSHIPGRIEKLFVSFTGEQIESGQKIATIYSPNLITAQKELIEANKVKDINPKLFEATRNKLKYWKITDVQIESILSEEKVQETFTIYADFSGVVQQKKVSVGDHLMEGGALFTVQNLNKLWVLFDVYEEQLSLVKVGDMVTFTTPSIPNKTFESKISFIDPVINPKTRTASVRLQINNSSKLLKPEMFVEGVLTTSKAKKLSSKAIVVPKTAILWTGERSVVYLKLPNTTVPSFEFTEVQLGSSIGGSYIVLDGLKEGDEVVTNGAFVIDASAQLNNQSSMMNRNLLNAVSEETEEDAVLPDYTSETPDKFKKQLETLDNQYVKVKDAFVATDATLASSEAKALIPLIAKVDMSLVKGDAHMYWMKQMKIIKEKATQITELTDVEKQRESFDLLSMAIINSTKVFGVDSQTFYVLYCPMAIDDDGSFWLSAENKVLNPYFGEQMLTCGEVKDTLK